MANVVTTPQSNTVFIFQRSRFVVTALGVLTFAYLYLDTLAAYNVVFIPVPWIAFALAGVACVEILIRNNGFVPVPPGFRWLLVYLAISILITLTYIVFAGPYKMPPGATLPYYPFVLARILKITGYALILLAAYNYCRRYGAHSALKLFMIVGSLVVISAIYIYIAQLFGLWEPGRTRIGTGGQDYSTQSVSFSYVFHRALGTFREPSHLAEWLVGYIVISLTLLVRGSSGWHIIRLALSFIALILTGSLVGVLSLFSATIFLVIMGYINISTRTIIVVLLGGMSVFVVEYGIGLPFLSVIMSRLDVLLYEGIGATNREIIVTYIFNSPPPIFGYGLGNANVILSDFFNNTLVSSHLSLFVGAAYSTGVVGVAMIVIFFGIPYYAALRRKRFWRDPLIMGCLAAHSAWMVSYAGLSEELIGVHAFILGLLFARARELVVERRRPEGSNPTSNCSV